MNKGCFKNKQKRLAKKKMILEQGKCAFCEAKDNLTIDHIIPASFGGSNAQSNWRVLCKLCNEKKGNSLSTDTFYRV